MELSALSIGLALAAGLVSFLSPCVLPLVPAYVAWLTGGAEEPRAAPWSGVAFVLGLSLVFVAVFYALRALLGPVRAYVPPVAGAIVIVMAFQVAGLLRLPFLTRELRLMKAAPARRGVPGAFLLGVGFAAGWTPCIGATLGAVLSSAIASGATWGGLLLIVAYCLGLSLPFLALSLGIGRLLPLLRGLGRRRRALDLASGGVLLAMGVLLLTNNLVLVTQLASRVWPSSLQVPFGL